MVITSYLSNTGYPKPIKVFSYDFGDDHNIIQNVFGIEPPCPSGYEINSNLQEFLKTLDKHSLKTLRNGFGPD